MTLVFVGMPQIRQLDFKKEIWTVSQFRKKEKKRAQANLEHVQHANLQVSQIRKKEEEMCV